MKFSRHISFSGKDMSLTLGRPMSRISPLDYKAAIPELISSSVHSPKVSKKPSHIECHPNNNSNSKKSFTSE